MAAARESAARKGRAGWRFTLQAPNYIAVMTYLDDAAIRRAVSTRPSCVRATEGECDNRPLLGRILELRAREGARCWASRDFADLVLEDRMAHTGARAMAFLEDLKAKTERASTRRTASCWNSGARSKGPARRSSSPGTSPTTPKSSAPRSTISTKRRCGPISRWSAWWPACSSSSAACTACA